MSDQLQAPLEQSAPQPEVAIQNVVRILAKARTNLETLRGSKKAVDALRDDLYAADAELGWAAWQVGTLRGKLSKERRAREEAEALLRSVMQPSRGQRPTGHV